MRAVPYNYILDTTHAFLISIFHTIFKSKPQDPLSPKQNKTTERRRSFGFVSSSILEDSYSTILSAYNYVPNKQVE